MDQNENEEAMTMEQYLMLARLLQFTADEKQTEDPGDDKNDDDDDLESIGSQPLISFDEKLWNSFLSFSSFEDKIGPDIIFTIFTHFSAIELLKMGLVCSSWYDISNSEALWANLVTSKEIKQTLFSKNGKSTLTTKQIVLRHLRKEALISKFIPRLSTTTSSTSTSKNAGSFQISFVTCANATIQLKRNAKDTNLLDFTVSSASPHDPLCLKISNSLIGNIQSSVEQEKYLSIGVKSIWIVLRKMLVSQLQKTRRRMKNVKKDISELSVIRRQQQKPQKGKQEEEKDAEIEAQEEQEDDLENEMKILNEISDELSTRKIDQSCLDVLEFALPLLNLSDKRSNRKKCAAAIARKEFPREFGNYVSKLRTNIHGTSSKSIRFLQKTLDEDELEIALKEHLLNEEDDDDDDEFESKEEANLIADWIFCVRKICFKTRLRLLERIDALLETLEENLVHFMQELIIQ